MIIDGRLPKPKKTLGGDKYWFQDELDEDYDDYDDDYKRSSRHSFPRSRY